MVFHYYSGLQESGHFSQENNFDLKIPASANQILHQLRQQQTSVLHDNPGASTGLCAATEKAANLPLPAGKSSLLFTREEEQPREVGRRP